jgi:hypothetical protein
MKRSGLSEGVESRSLVSVLALPSALLLMAVLMLTAQDNYVAEDELGYELGKAAVGRTRRALVLVLGQLEGSPVKKYSQKSELVAP